MQGNPLVSIIVPCYNQEQFINEALESVYGQTYTNWECIVMDDGSTDRSEEIIQQWISKDPRFRYYYKDNGGIVETRNFAIQCTAGEFILPLDGDDKIAPEYVAEAVNEFVKAPETKLVYCNIIYFGKVNKRAGSPPYSFETMLYENLIHQGAMFRKADYEKTRGYNNNMFEGLEDWDFWLELLNPEDKVVKLDGFYYHYRIKDVSRSTLIDKEKNERLILQLFKNHEEKYLRFFNPVRDHINHLHYKAETERLKKSTEYKLGRIITCPFRLISKAVRKVFS